MTVLRNKVFLIVATLGILLIMSSSFFLRFNYPQCPVLDAVRNTTALHHPLPDRDVHPGSSHQHPGTARPDVPRLRVPDFVLRDDSRQIAELAASKSDRFVRGVCLFLPSESNGREFTTELKWFYRSWQEMLKTQPPKWRTDVLVITNYHIPVLDKISCTNITRQSRDDPSMCRYTAGYPNTLPDFEDYKVVYSIHALVWEGVNYDQYDYLLRSDIDTFLTPAFSTWRPDHMIVGGGGYIQGADLVTAGRLERASDYLRLKFKGMNNVGSTWYGPTPLVRKTGALSVEAMRYLKSHEFTKLERSPSFGIQGWPEWHYGVLALYGGHLAVNHLAVDYKIEINRDMLDFYSTSSLPAVEHAHIHTWHTDESFSKFVFFMDGYKNITLQSIDKRTCKGYCLYMALESRSMFS